MTDYPELKITEFYITLRNDIFTLRYDNRNTAVYMNDSLERPESVDYWRGMVLWYLFKDDAEGDYHVPVYTSTDVMRAAQACMFIDEIPEWTVLNNLIGYNPSHGKECDCWDDVRPRCKAYNYNANPFAEGAD
jgi:hypothetical protein